MDLQYEIHELALGDRIDNFTLESIWKWHADDEEDDNFQNEEPEEDQVHCVDHSRFVN